MRTLFSVLLVAALVTGAASAGQAQLNVALGQPTLVAGLKQTTFLKVGLTGFVFDSATVRPAVNVALVLDKSGSMSGEKIVKAREAAIAAIERLGPNDIVSIITFDTTVNVLVPATKLTDKDAMRAAIMQISAGGNTALFGGVSKGAEEIRKFFDKNRVNRVILLTDGQANVGPSSPAEVASLGASLKKENISVTTLGMGSDYNEDLLVQLAAKSDGNHAYIKSPNDAVRVFNSEFAEVLTVVAQEVCVKVQCAEGIRPVRVLGREAEIAGQTVYVQLQQLYSNQEKFLMLEVEIPAGEEGRNREVATVSVNYANMATKTTDKLSSTVSVSFTKSVAQAEKNENKVVMVDAIEQVAVHVNEKATALRDAGKTEEALKEFKENAVSLKKAGAKYSSSKLSAYVLDNEEATKNLAPDKWGGYRKGNLEDQYSRSKQMKKRSDD